jgi:hypothetical protein
MILEATKDSYITGWLALAVPESGVFYDELPSSQAIRTEVDQELCKALHQTIERIPHVEKSSLLSLVKYTDICKAARAVTSRNDFAQRDAHVLSRSQLQRHPLGLADSGPHIPSLVTANGIYRRTTGTLETRSLRDSRHKGFRMIAMEQI